MKIKHLRIENFRAIANFDEAIGPYTTFIGYNGGGKSSILHAVRWFFENFELKSTDVFSEEIGEPDLATLPNVKVTVTFDNLTELDRENFGPTLGVKKSYSRVLAVWEDLLSFTASV
ncbi:hypothetical protein BVL41_00465 [Corynebacterium diphtheriae]|nr:hypothetical protein BVH76_02635 [Corynebacterium diphtheriae]OLO24835.1 hypothetical protein BVH78_00195 [Corynebacterium diphtheriae]OMO44984.1 hypothetical protein BVL41_00465 [Corynebacterium diphtheriae]RKW82229.1 hypothetical protein D9B34_05210 [Corynebacterium diphtheriae]RKX04877.1 hypothetical protein D9C01_05180 [Corynebacterium diphtheriae]